MAVAATHNAAPDDPARIGLRDAGERIIELAKSIGIVPEDSAAAAGAPQIPEADQTEELRKRRQTRKRASPNSRRGSKKQTEISKSRKPG